MLFRSRACTKRSSLMAACRTPSCWNCSPTAAPVPASTAAATANKKIAQSPAESYNKGNETAPLLYDGWHNADAFILAGSPSPSPAVTHSPFCRCATSSPGAGEVFPQRERPWQRDEVCMDCQGLPLWGSWHRAAMTERARTLPVCSNVPSVSRKALRNRSMLQEVHLWILKKSSSGTTSTSCTPITAEIGRAHV